MPANPQNKMTREIKSLRRSLKAVDTSLKRLVPLLATAMEGRASEGGRIIRRRRISPQRRRELKLQGRYIGYLRQLRPRERADIQKVRTRRGIEAAIRKARQMAHQKRAA